MQRHNITEERVPWERSWDYGGYGPTCLEIQRRPGIVLCNSTAGPLTFLFSALAQLFLVTLI